MCLDHQPESCHVAGVGIDIEGIDSDGIDVPSGPLKSRQGKLMLEPIGSDTCRGTRITYRFSCDVGNPEPINSILFNWHCGITLDQAANVWVLESPFLGTDVQIRDFIDESHEALAQAQAESLQVSISMDAGDLDWPDIRALVLAYERVEPIARMLGGDIDNPACQPLDLAYTTALGLRYKSSEPGGAYRSQITGVAAAGAGAAGRLTPDQAERAGRSRCRVGDFTPMTRSGIEITSWLTGHRGAGRPISQRKHAKAAPGTCVVFNAVHRWRNGDRVYNCAMFYQDLMLSARLLGVARGGIMLPRSAIKAAEAISPGLKASIIASVQTWRKNFPPGEREYVVAKGKWVTR